MNIECIGLGVQKFTFKDETARLAAGKHRSPNDTSQSSLSYRPKRTTTNKDDPPNDESPGDQTNSGQLQVVKLAAVSRSSGKDPTAFHNDYVSVYMLPMNNLDRVTLTLTASIDVSLGSKMGLLWNFGPFLEDIPCRLGRNAALDAATEAMLAAYGSFKARTTMTHYPVQNTTRAYCRALRAMRQALGNAETARSPETLCSTMIMLICEALNGPKDDWAMNLLTHAGGAAKIIKSRGYKKSTSDFEERVLLSLRGPIVLLSLFKKKQDFTAKEWTDLVTNPLEGDNVDNRTIQTMAKLPNLLRTVQEAYVQEPIDLEALSRAEATLTSMRDLHAIDRAEICDRFKDFEERCQMHPLLMPPKLNVLHSHFARQAAMAYAIEIYVNLVLSGAARKARGYQTRVPLVDEHLLAADACVEEILSLGELVQVHRPLGTIYMGYAMTAALAAALTDDLRGRVMLQAQGFVDDMYGPGGSPGMSHLCGLSDYLTCRDLRTWHLEKGFINELATEGRDPYLVD